MLDPRIAIVLSDEHEPKARAALGRVVTSPVYVIDRVGKIVYQTALPPAASLREDLRPYIVVWIGVGPTVAQRLGGPQSDPVGEAPEDRFVEDRWMMIQSRNKVLDAIRDAQGTVDAVEARHRAAAAGAKRKRAVVAAADRQALVLAARRREQETVWLFVPAGLG